MPHLCLTLFGNFGAMIDGEPVNGFESNKVRALLAYLAVESAQPHTRSALAGLFWPECAEQQARQSLSQALYNLRHLLGETQRGPNTFLLTTPQTIQFNPHSDHRVDVHEFTQAIQITPPNTPVGDAVIPTLTHALTLYTAPFLHEFALKDSLAFEEWVLITRERLHRLALSALQTLATLHENRGELAEALRHARRAVELDPLWDAAHRQVMHLLALSGARTQALAQYETLRETLMDALGVEPELETQKLYTHLQAPAPADPAPACRHNLPASLTPFIGRKHELDEVTACLCDADCRLLTILGPGGSGKTRFAVEAARRVLDAFPDGVWLIPLASVTTPEGIIPALVRGLGVYLQENVPAERQVQDFLREKRLLLILDNYEHLLPEVNWPVQTLREAAGVKLLITSRAPLEVKGEHHYPLAGLALPHAGDTLSGARFSAVQLFVDAAQRASPTFSLTGTNLPAVVDICRMVDGLPLGVILAAAWVGTYSPNEILTEMRCDLDFLETTWADVPARQRSLRATFAYSWRLLSDPERGVMRTLAVFRGGFTREAAREVSGATARDLLSLANKSLIQSTGNGRFYLHELVRQFGGEQLDANPDLAQAVHLRHSAYYLKKLESWAEGMKGSHQRETLEELDLEFANARAAWDWAVNTGAWERIAKTIEGLGRYYLRRLRLQEGVSAFQTARLALEKLPGIGSYVPLQIFFQIWEGWLHHADACPALAFQSWTACDELLGALDPQLPIVLNIQAFLHFVRGAAYLMRDNRQAKVFLEQSVTLYRRLGDKFWLGESLLLLAQTAINLGHPETAQTYLAEAISLERALGNPAGLSEALGSNAMINLRLGFTQEAIRIAQETLTIMAANGLTNSRGRAGLVFMYCGHYETARAVFKETLALRRISGSKYNIALAVGHVGAISIYTGDYHEARSLSLSTLSFMQEYHDPRIAAHAMIHLGLLKVIEKNYEQGYQDISAGVHIIRELHLLAEGEYPVYFLAWAARFSGRLTLAQQALEEGLHNSVKYRGWPQIAWALAGAALLAVNQGAFAEAVFLYHVAHQFPTFANAHFKETLFETEIMSVAQNHLTSQEIADAEARGRACDPFEVARELLSHSSHNGPNPNSSIFHVQVKAEGS